MHLSPSFCYDDLLAFFMTSTGISPENKRELFLRACRSEPVPRVPVWIMRQAGRYLPEYREIRAKRGFLEICKTPELATELSLQPFRALGVDAVIVFSDILIPAEAMGLKVDFTDSGPVVENRIREAAQVKALREFDPERETRFVGEAIRTLVGILGAEVPVIGFAAAPWTLACYMVEGRAQDAFSATKQFMYQEPAGFRALLEKIAKTTALYLNAQIAAGATAVQLFDTWAGELRRRDYEQFALPTTQLLISQLDPGVPVILYTKASSHLLPAVARAGANVLSVDWRVDLAELRDALGGRIAVQGNVDPCLLLGPEENIRDAVRETLEKTSGLGHILNLGHGILPATPVEAARVFVQAAQTTFFPAHAVPGRAR